MFHEKERGVSYGAETDFNSSEVWRGILLDNAPVAEPSAWISAHGFTFTAWRNLPLTSTQASVHLHTTDLALAYIYDWNKLRIEPAVDVYFNQPVGGIHDPNTMEASLKFSYPIGPLRIFLSNSFDVLAYRGALFGEIGLSYSGKLTKSTELSVSTSAGWASAKFNAAYIGPREPALNVIECGGSLIYHVQQHLYFQPHIEFSHILDPRLREYLSHPTVVNFGLAVGLDF